MKLKAKLYEGDMPNANGVIYPKEALEKAVAEWNAKDGVALYESYSCSVDESTDEYSKSQYETNLTHVAGKCKLSMEGDFVVAHIEVLDTEAGVALKDQLESPLQELSMCLPKGVGKVSELGTTYMESISILKVVCSSDDVCVGENQSNLFKIEEE